MEYSFSETNLRDVPVEVYHEYKDKLPENWRKRRALVHRVCQS